MVSIIIPTYNRATWIATSIGSIQRQTFSNWECIVVDDHSTDDTHLIIRDFSNSDPRIKYLINERKRGAQGARNTGILYAKYDWIAFNDSDDIWLPDKLEKQIAALARVHNEVHTVVHGRCLVNDFSNGPLVPWVSRPIEGRYLFPDLLRSPGPFFQAMLTSKIALLAIGLLDEDVPSYQEWDTSIMLSRVCSFYQIDSPLFIYQKHHEETISKDQARDILGRSYISFKYSKDYIAIYGSTAFKHELISNVRSAFNNRLWGLAEQLLLSSKPFMSQGAYICLKCSMVFKINIFTKTPLFNLLRKVFL